MKKLIFTKMVGSGNDFIIVEKKKLPRLIKLSKLAQKLCDRKLGVGADGLLVLEKSKKDKGRLVHMRIFNADGSEAEMCGNGARCCVYYVAKVMSSKKKSVVYLSTVAGLLTGRIEGSSVKLNMTNPEGLRRRIPLGLDGHLRLVDFIDTGVPHAVVYSSALLHCPVVKIGRLIRHHRFFRPRGTNVNFVKVLGPGRIQIRTYERGVEDETLACGTGSVAAAILSTLRSKKTRPLRGPAKEYQVGVETRSGEVLKVYFKIEDEKISSVWLQGKTKVVYKGNFYF